MKILPLLLLCSVLLASCADDDPEERETAFSRNIFLNYSITADEARENVACKFEFKRGGSTGRAIRLLGPGGVMLDGEAVPADSSRYAGVFYETMRPLVSFQGKHEISFTGPDGALLQESFEFRPFSLSDSLPAVISRRPFVISLRNPPPDGQTMQLVMIDTSFESLDVNEFVEVLNGEIRVTEAMLQKLVNGPIIFELHMEKASPLKQSTEAGGRLTIFYSLKREFTLEG